MKKKKEKLIRMTGGIVLLTMMAFNFAHAFNNYGILTNPISSPVLGQAYSSSSTSTSTSSNEKKHCKQDSDQFTIRTYCTSYDKYSSCDYTVSSWSCDKGDDYSCTEGTITTGHSCNTDYNSSNCGTTTLKNC